MAVPARHRDIDGNPVVGYKSWPNRVTLLLRRKAAKDIWDYRGLRASCR